MNSKNWIGASILAMLSTLALGAFAAEQRIEKKVIVLGGPAAHGSVADKVTITDVDTLAIGEARDYSSPSGKQFTVTRDAEEHWTLSGEGKEFGFGGAPEDIEVHGADNATMNKRVIVIDGDPEHGGAEIHAMAGGDAKNVQVFVGKEGEDGAQVQRILVNGEPIDPKGDNVKIIVKMDGASGEDHAIWIDKDGTTHEGLPEHGLMMIETEDRQGGGDLEGATMVEIVRESGGEQEKRIEKRVFLFAAGDDEN